MGLLRELSAQVVTLENMAFVELQTYSAHPVVVCLLVFTAAVAARLLVSRLPKNREERDGQVKIPQSLLILRRLSHFSWINIFHDCSKTLANFQNSEQLDIFFLSVHLVVLWIFFRHSLHPFRRASLLLSFLVQFRSSVDWMRFIHTREGDLLHLVAESNPSTLSWKLLEKSLTKYLGTQTSWHKINYYTGSYSYLLTSSWANFPFHRPCRWLSDDEALQPNSSQWFLLILCTNTTTVNNG